MSGFSSSSAGLGATFNTNQSLVSDTKRLIDSAEEAAFTFISEQVNTAKGYVQDLKNVKGQLQDAQGLPGLSSSLKQGIQALVPKLNNEIGRANDYINANTDIHGNPVLSGGLSGGLPDGRLAGLGAGLGQPQGFQPNEDLVSEVNALMERINNEVGGASSTGGSSGLVSTQSGRTQGGAVQAGFGGQFGPLGYAAIGAAGILLASTVLSNLSN